jgi:hypothetical protein
MWLPNYRMAYYASRLHERQHDLRLLINVSEVVELPLAGTVWLR